MLKCPRGGWRLYVIRSTTTHICWEETWSSVEYWLSGLVRRTATISRSQLNQLQKTVMNVNVNHPITITIWCDIRTRNNCFLISDFWIYFLISSLLKLKLIIKLTIKCYDNKFRAHELINKSTHSALNCIWGNKAAQQLQLNRTV